MSSVITAQSLIDTNELIINTPNTNIKCFTKDYGVKLFDDHKYSGDGCEIIVFNTKTMKDLFHISFDKNVSKMLICENNLFISSSLTNFSDTCWTFVYDILNAKLIRQFEGFILANHGNFLIMQGQGKASQKYYLKVLDSAFNHKFTIPYDDWINSYPVFYNKDLIYIPLSNYPVDSVLIYSYSEESLRDKISIEEYLDFFESNSNNQNQFDRFEEFANSISIEEIQNYLGIKKSILNPLEYLSKVNYINCHDSLFMVNNDSAITINLKNQLTEETIKKVENMDNAPKPFSVKYTEGPGTIKVFKKQDLLFQYPDSCIYDWMTPLNFSNNNKSLILANISHRGEENAVDVYDFNMVNSSFLTCTFYDNGFDHYFFKNLYFTAKYRDGYILFHNSANSNSEFVGQVSFYDLNGFFQKKIILDYVIQNVYHLDENNLILDLNSDRLAIVNISKSEIRYYRMNDGFKSSNFINLNNLSFLISHHQSGFNNFYLFKDFNLSMVFQRIEFKEQNYFVKLPNSPYYMCSKNASKMLHYVTPSLKVIGFDQLDPVYNRPDIVLDGIGKYFGGADQELVARYREAWEKRIDRLGLDKEKLGKGEISVPNAVFVGAEDIAYDNSSGQLELKVEANDPKYTLRRFNILVNEVPLYGSEGISIAARGLMEWDTTISVPLGVGENKIQVSVMNELGLENFKYPTYVNYTPEREELVVSKTYFIGIGVDDFKDDQIADLDYCVKDIKDLAKAFQSNSQTKSIVLTNEEVTKENVLALKNTLKNTSVHDKVIISCSSHGLLDDQKRFYLAMHDIDANHPEDRGLPYKALESLLDSIPARQKLLMLDACNSGENEIEDAQEGEIELAQNTAETNKADGGRNIITLKSKSSRKSSFETMMELFVNVSNETGAVVISASGGKQSALEGQAVEVDGKPIKNGAFTHSVLEYLKQTDETLTVNGLKSYVENRVQEITNGKQRPTSRQEKMEVNWDLR